MQRKEYILYLDYLGYRYSGWQIQPQVRTIEGMLKKTLKFVLPHHQIKLLGAGRTDAKVSARNYPCQLIMKGEKIELGTDFLERMNQNLPPDIRLNNYRKAPEGFNVIKHCQSKTYGYYFTNLEKLDPFFAPFFVNFRGSLDLEAMRKATKILEGEHNFRAFTAKPSEQTNLIRTLNGASICKTDSPFAVDFPIYKFEVRAKGFLRYQVRMMMWALKEIGLGNMSKKDLQQYLEATGNIQLPGIAPGSGLVLEGVKFIDL